MRVAVGLSRSRAGEDWVDQEPLDARTHDLIDHLPAKIQSFSQSLSHRWQRPLEDRNHQCK